MEEAQPCPVCGRPVHLKHFEKHLKIHEEEARGAKPSAPTPPAVKPRSLIGLSIRSAVLRFPNLSMSVANKFGLKKQFEKASIYISPRGYAAAALNWTLLTMVIPIVSVISAVLLSNWMLLLFAPTPLFIFFAFMFYPSLKVSSRKSSVDSELPILATYMAMVNSAGVSLLHGFRKLVGLKLLPAVGEESSRIIRDSTVFGREPVNALDTLSQKHPSENFRRWLSGLTYTQRVGGNVTRYLENSADRSLRELAVSWRHFTELAMMYADVVIAVFALLPLCIFIMVVGFIAAADPTYLIVYSFAVAPLIAIVLIVLIDQACPKTPEKLTRYYQQLAFTLPLGAFIGFSAFYMADFKVHVCLALAIMAAFLPPAMKFQLDSRRENAVEKSIPEFISDVTEAKRIGQPLEKTIVNLAHQKRYSNALNRIVEQLAAQIPNPSTSIASAVDRAKRGVRSWYANVMFFLLREAISTGGGTVPVFERLSRFTASYSDIRSRIKRQLQLHMLIFYATAFIVVFTVTQVMTTTLLPQVILAKELGGGQAIPGIYVPTEEALNYLTAAVMTGTVVNSLLLGALGGKIVGGSIASGFKHIFLIVFVTLVAFAVAGVL